MRCRRRKVTKMIDGTVAAIVTAGVAVVQVVVLDMRRTAATVTC